MKCVFLINCCFYKSTDLVWIAKFGLSVWIEREAEMVSIHVLDWCRLGADTKAGDEDIDDGDDEDQDGAHIVQAIQALLAIGIVEVDVANEDEDDAHQNLEHDGQQDECDQDVVELVLVTKLQ